MSGLCVILLVPGGSGAGQIAQVKNIQVTSRHVILLFSGGSDQVLQPNKRRRKEEEEKKAIYQKRK